jgi:hypothetical protein
LERWDGVVCIRLVLDQDSNRWRELL